MKKRVASSLALWGTLFALLYFLQIHGGILILAYFSAGAQWELYQIWQKAGRRVAPRAGTIAGTLLIPAAYYLDGQIEGLVPEPWGRIALLGLSAILLAWALFFIFPPRTRFPGEALVPTALGICTSPSITS